MKKRQLSLLSTSRFLPLFLTQSLSALNDNLFKNALVILTTYRVTEIGGLSAPVLITLAAALFIFPFFIFSATAGQLTDKYEKSFLISIIKFIEIILMVVGAIGFYLQNISLLMLILFGLGAHAAFFGPLKYAILPDHLKEDELIAGNGIIEAGTFLSILLGTVIGGVFILQSSGEYLIICMLLLISILGFLISRWIPKTENPNPNLKINFNFFKETFHLLKYAKSRPEIFLPILGISWFWLVGATFLAEFPSIGKDILHAHQGVVTFFLVLFSIGLAVGSLFCNQLLKGKVHATYVPLGAFGMTLFIIDFYFSLKSFPLAPFNTSFISISQFLSTFTGCRITFDLLFIAIFGGIYTVPLYALLQHRSEKAHRGRIIAINNILNALFMVASAMTIIFLLQINFTIPEAFLVVGIANGLVAAYICKLLPDLVVKAIFRWILKMLYRVKINGLEHYYQAGKRVVIVANHTSFIDAVLLACFLPDKLTFAVNTLASQQWWICFFLRFVETYPIDPTNQMEIKSLIKCVQKDKRCVIFPEGRLTMTGSLMKIYEGPGLISDKAEANLLPICIQGTQFTVFSRLKGKVRIRWMPKVVINIFPPQVLEISTELRGRKRRQAIGLKLYDLMTKIMFESSCIDQTLFSSLLDARSIQGRYYSVLEDIERKPLSYQQLIMRSFILGRIIAKETQPGQGVGILLPNMNIAAIAFFALQAYFRLPALLNFSAGSTAIVSACQTASLKIIYTSRKFIFSANLSGLIQALDEVDIRTVYLEDLSASVDIFDKLKGFFMAQAPSFFYRHILSPKRPHDFLSSEGAAVILFTSGSEGAPKGVVLSHRNVQANRFQLSAVIDFTANDKVFNALPIFHSFGLTGGMILPLLSGVKTFFYPSPLHYRIVPELVYDTNSTLLFGTDTFLAGYAKHAHPYDFYSIRYVFAGAEKLREETYDQWSKKFGIRIFEGYGLTETSPVLATNSPMHHKIGTVGRLLPGVDYKLHLVPEIKEGGILMVKGPNIMKGYLLASHPGKILPSDQEWYDTGDVVSIDEMGFCSIKGRIKRFAKIGGEMVSLSMVEQQIRLLWPEDQHAVVSISDLKKGEQIILVTTYSQATREEIIQHFRFYGLAEIAIPRKIIAELKIPLLGTGKIDYVEVKKNVFYRLAEESAVLC